MPWYWTDDLARTLLETGRAEQSQVSGWLASPVAIRSDESAESVAEDLLASDDGDPSKRLAA